MTKIGNFINKQKEKLVQLLPYNAVINPVTRKPLDRELTELNLKVGELETSKQDSLTPGSGITIEDNVISATGIPDAPVDGKQYARQDGAWEEVKGGGGGSTTLEQIADITLSEEVKVVNVATTKDYHRILFLLDLKANTAGTSNWFQMYFNEKLVQQFSSFVPTTGAKKAYFGLEKHGDLWIPSIAIINNQPTQDYLNSILYSGLVYSSFANITESINSISLKSNWAEFGVGSQFRIYAE